MILVVVKLLMQAIIRGNMKRKQCKANKKYVVGHTYACLLKGWNAYTILAFIFHLVSFNRRN